MAGHRCVLCEIPMPCHGLRCGFCRERCRRYNLARRHALRGHGLCVDCKAKSGRYRCAGCRARVAENVRRCRARRSLKE